MSLEQAPMRDDSLFPANLLSSSCRQGASMSENEIQARQAIKYVKCMIDLGAGNRLQPFLPWARFGNNWARGWLGDLVLDGPDSKDQRIPEYIRLADTRGRAFHVGNCGEHAAVAFMYLARNNKFPIDYMDSLPCVDHAWVVIGRVDGSEVDNPNTWGDDCYICDAWDDKVFSASRFRREMHKGDIAVPRTNCRLTQ
jgi:hypothetical protein